MSGLDPAGAGLKLPSKSFNKETEGSPAPIAGENSDSSKLKSFTSTKSGSESIFPVPKCPPSTIECVIKFIPPVST